MDEEKKYLLAVIQLYNRAVTFVYETSLLDIRVATARFTDERLASFFYTRSKLTHETLHSGPFCTNFVQKLKRFFLHSGFHLKYHDILKNLYWLPSQLKETAIVFSIKPKLDYQFFVLSLQSNKVE